MSCAIWRHKAKGFFVFPYLSNWQETVSITTATPSKTGTKAGRDWSQAFRWMAIQEER